MPSRRQLAVAAGLFVLTLLVRLPLGWCVGLLPAALNCVGASGTVWSGRCASVGRAPLQLQEVGWRLEPWLLLAGRLGALVHSDDPRAPLDAELRFGPGGRIELRDVKGSVALEAGLLPLFPENWGGTLQLDVARAGLRGGSLQDIAGVLRVAGLRTRRGGSDLGNYELRFAGADADGNIEGALRDTGGPLEVAGRLRLGRDGSYELGGTARARPGAPADLAAALEALGAADASGRRSFSLAGSF